MIVTPRPREQTRARYPDEEGYVERDGVRVFYEVYGDAPTTFLLFPTSPISISVAPTATTTRTNPSVIMTRRLRRSLRLREALASMSR